MVPKHVFSPSSTKLWDRCKVRYHFERRLGLSPAYADNALYARIGGTAFHAGAATLHRQRQIGSPIQIAPALETLKAVYDLMFEAYQKAGGNYSEETTTKNLLIAGRTLQKYADDPVSPLRNWKEITDVELVLDSFGPCRLDLVGVDALGIHTIADLKYKKELKAELEGKTFNQLRGEWGLSHYKWALPQARPEGPREYATKIILVAGSAYRILEWSMPVLEEQDFLQAAYYRWEEMTEGREWPAKDLPMATTHEDQYGICPFLRTCTDLDRDPLQDAATPFIHVDWPRGIDE